MDFFHAHQAQHYLVLAALLFALGAAGVVLRRNAIIVLMSIELMLNAVNLTFLAFSRFPLVPNPPMGSFLSGHAAAFFVIATAAAEAAVGLAIIIAVFRSRTSVNVDEFDTLKL
ncbi:MAG: NADH-quinone oxidoreductase subunit NuoK [Deltaproteobacteria bacterium]|nr:MAG: NADH-quinone oxidoreductase subunit NuoK [Deltaproteobacteria bacterium]TMB36374.1 MAG: NADH-quinone oxidoreductase subunit NuoK [Deltaproteobacteria bacterium]